jgi:methionyl aminopeptidase
MIILKTDREIGIMREANRIIAVILNEIGDRIAPGACTLDLDTWAEKRLGEMNARPAFKGYRNYPATLCTSINCEVVHGIPTKERILREGDIVGIDIGSIYGGYYGDGAWTFAVGQISDEASALMETCRTALDVGIAEAKEGNCVGDISRAIDRSVRSRHFEIVRDLSGHGIGRNLHEEPVVLNYDDGRHGQRLKRNMTLAIEPMITAGTYQVKTLADRWTVVTADGSLSAHYEHTVAITANGPEILTRI